MTIGAITLEADVAGKQPSAPLFAHHIQLDADDAYPTGGSADFQAAVQEAINVPGANILTVTQNGPCGGYLPIYDQANDKLMMFQYPDALGPATEVPDTTDLSAVSLDLLVLSY